MTFTLNSGLKIFEIIKILQNSPKTREEICSRLALSSVYIEPKTVSKYIKTLKEAGFEIITKKGQNYEITKSPFKISLDENENLGYLALMEAIYALSKDKGELKQLEYKLENLVKAKTKDFTSDKYGFEDSAYESFEKLAEYIFNSSKISFSYQDKKITGIPIKIKYGSKNIVVYIFNFQSKNIEEFNLNDIKNVKFVAKTKSIDFDFFPKTIFKIKGDLIKSYILKEGETARYNGKEVQVTNYREEKEELFKRLMKYGKHCEIIYPESDRKKFVEMVEGLIAHYKSI